MEAEVYACGLNAVLKLYTGTTTLAELHILQDFYNSLDRQHVPYALPRIYTVAQEDRFLMPQSPHRRDWHSQVWG